jgi:predicted transposase/invertase (TIGR01784 family)
VLIYNEIITADIQFITKEENSSVLLWAKFINAERKEDFDMLAEKDPYIESAYQRLQVISQDKDKRLEYEAREKAIRDYNQFLKEADARGEQRGIQIGEQRGIQIGEHKKAAEIAKNLLAMGMAAEAVAAGTGLTEQEVEAVRREAAAD